LVFKKKGLSEWGNLSPDEEAVTPPTIHQEDGGDDQHHAVLAATERSTQLPALKGTLYWENVSYKVKTRDGQRQILDKIDGWLRPGTLTALMVGVSFSSVPFESFELTLMKGVTGAGKTSLLDVLAKQTTTGIIGGEIRVHGFSRNAHLRRSMGYVQQEDIHLATATVREALEFSALLRQPNTRSREEKLRSVDMVLDALHMSSYADALVGVPGEGLNIEQGKRLTIGVEMAALPELLLFLGRMSPAF
jgi:ATP-binding cassette, subfamily G (WHITE), member 2, PDR